MRIKQISINNFRRFTDLKILDLPETTKLVILAGPNGCGKSSLFDALSFRYQYDIAIGWNNDAKYYFKKPSTDWANRVKIDFYRGEPIQKGAFYFRSAYRNDPEFSLNSLSRVGPALDEIRFRRMIETDAAVTQNYQRLVSQAFEDVFQKENPATTIGEFRESVVGKVRESIKRIFPDLTLNSLGNPLAEGTFRFDKGTTTAFEYKNLSGGEKAAFDLVLDIVVKADAYPEAVYLIDEPEAHMNTRLQGALLEELVKLVPEKSQLWISTHSIGMMRKARELYNASPNSVTFLDFGSHDFDQSVEIQPSRPNRSFWEKVLDVALDDLATLVSPSEVIICEGNPSGAVPGKNAEHDATCYAAIFAEEKPDTKFISGGNSHDVASDRLGFAAAFPALIPGIAVRRLIDRDDHASADVVEFKKNGIITLGRRHIESYLYDDEVLQALCNSVGKSSEAPALIQEKQDALTTISNQGKSADDVKSAAGIIYTKAKARLALTAVGNDQKAFARNTLAPLLKPGMKIYDELKKDIFV